MIQKLCLFNPAECEHEFVDWAIHVIAGTKDNIEMCVKCGEIKDPDNLLKLNPAEYKYLGDRISDRKGQLCSAVRNAAGKCIRGKNSNMLVKFEDGTTSVILARLLRKINKNCNKKENGK